MVCDIECKCYNMVRNQNYLKIFKNCCQVYFYIFFFHHSDWVSILQNKKVADSFQDLGICCTFVFIMLQPWDTKLNLYFLLSQNCWAVLSYTPSFVWCWKLGTTWMPWVIFLLFQPDKAELVFCLCTIHHSLGSGCIQGRQSDWAPVFV